MAKPQKTVTAETGDYVSLFLVGLIWSLIFLANEIALKSVGPVLLTTGRIILGTALLFGYASLKGESLPTDWRSWKYFILLGICVTAAWTVVPWAQKTLDSHVTAIIIATGPLVTMIMSSLLTKDDKITRMKILGLVVGFSGVVVLAGGVPVNQMAVDLPAQLAVFSVLFFYGVVLIVSRKLAHLSPLITSLGGLIVASVILLVASAVFEPPWNADLAWPGALAIVYLGIVVSAYGYLLSIKLVKRTGATFTANFYYLVPTFAIVWGVYFLNETVSWTAFLAVALVLAGLWITNISPSQKSRPRFPHSPH